jgi:hypothetical protein
VQLDDPLLQFQPLKTGSDLVIFAHARKNPAGEERLVRVLLGADQNIPSNAGMDGNVRYYEVRATRFLDARVILDDGKQTPRTTLQLDRTNRAHIVVTLDGAGANQDKVEYQLAGLFRVYAGQVDPADASHFTVDVDYDRHRKVIDGWLRADDHVELMPRSGRITDRDPKGTRMVWDPTLPPATQGR